MIKVNFIPEERRKSRGGFLEEGIGGLPREIIVGIFFALGVLVMCVHLVFFLMMAGQMTRHALLSAQWASLAADRKALEDITSETQSIQKKMFALKPITSVRSIIWSKFFNEISDSVPKGVWLKEVRFEKKELVIRGSAVSKVSNEMVVANNFVTELISKPQMKEMFARIDIDSIERRQTSATPIADFSLKAIRREAP